MTPTPQPKALELADDLERHVYTESRWGKDKCDEAASELRRQHAEIEALKTEVERIGNNRDMWKGQCERQSAELERRQEDVMRLDWLSDIALSMDAESDPDHLTVVFFGENPVRQSYGMTLRSAIDAAIAATQETK